MNKTDDVGVFSDEIRNELKSGFGSEGEPRFITGGARDIQTIFNNIKAQPSNTPADDPGDMVQYIEAHDNLPLYDIIAKALKKDPAVPENDLEIHKRIRLGNSLILTSQGTAFLHAGQEYGRTKQWLGEGVPEQKYDAFTDENGKVFGYFVHDSYDSSDAINMFDWSKATNKEEYAVNNETMEFTKGLIELRKSSNAFRLGEKSLVDSNVTMVEAKEIEEEDLVIAYKNESTDNTGSYYVFMNGDTKSRELSLSEDLTDFKIVVDNDEAGKDAVTEKSGFTLTADKITLDPLTTVVIKTEKEDTAGDPDVDTPNPTTPENPDDSIDPDTPEQETPADTDEKPDGSDKEVDGSTDDKVENGGEKSENSLPNTATNNGTYLLAGIIILMVGVSLLVIIRRKKHAGQ